MTCNKKPLNKLSCPSPFGTENMLRRASRFLMCMDSRFRGNDVNKIFQASHKPRHCHRGFSYIEILIATFLIAVTLVPAINSLQTGVQSTGTHRTHVENHLSLKSKMEDMLAQTMAALDTEAQLINDPNTPSSTYSDTAGTPHRRLVYLSRYDGDNLDGDNDPFTGKDSGLIWVHVEIEGTPESLQTLTTQ